jgi:hypothetical protein
MGDFHDNFHRISTAYHAEKNDALTGCSLSHQLTPAGLVAHRKSDGIDEGAGGRAPCLGGALVEPVRSHQKALSNSFVFPATNSLMLPAP